MPASPAISPSFCATEATLDALSNGSFFAEQASSINKISSNKKLRRATLAHYEKIFVFIVDPKSSKAASLYSFFIASAAFISCFMLFMQTLDGPNHHSTYPDYPKLPSEHDYFVSDLVFTVIFTTELLVRMAIWPSFWNEHEYLTEQRLKPFLRDPFNWFDVAAIIPFYSDLVLGRDKSFVLMRLCRLLRIFKLARNHSGDVHPAARDPREPRADLHCAHLLRGDRALLLRRHVHGGPEPGPQQERLLGSAHDGALAAAGGDGNGAHSAELAAAVDDTDREKHEVLIKYNAPNKLYLRLAGLTGEASLMTQALVAETASVDFSVANVREIVDDLTRQMQLCCLKCSELGALVLEIIVPEVETAPEQPSFAAWLSLALSDPNSSRLAKGISRWIRFCQIFSMIIVVFQTMPDLQTDGESTYLCERIVKRYCEDAQGVTSLTDPGCFRADSPLERIRFDCSDKEQLTDASCFGYGLNYGSSSPYGLTCDNGTTLTSKEPGPSLIDGASSSTALYFTGDLSLEDPFRLNNALSIKDRELSVCNKWECDNLYVTFFEFGDAYVAAEYLFTLTYLVGFAAVMYVCQDYRAYFRNPVVFLEMASFLPFFVLEFSRALPSTTQPPIYVIPPGSTDFLTFLRLLRLARIFKIQQSIPVTKVLWESISKTSTRLTIPYFMLIVVTTILSFVMYELEKGQECFYGQECIVNGKNMTFPPELVGSVPNKRFLVNIKGNLSTFDDFFSAFWFVIVTISTIVNNLRREGVRLAEQQTAALKSIN
ncbi:Voltage-gated ion channel superfamily, partial [Globisporangium splendens]